MSTSTSQSTNNSRLKNEFGADLWIRDPETRRKPTAGRGLFAGLQDVKHYNVERGWAKRQVDAQPGFFASIFNSSRAEHESWWRPMRAWMMMRAAVMESGKTHFGPLVLEPIPLYTSAPPRSPVEALALRMRQSAQQRTMATMASPSPSPLPFIPPHNRPRRPPRIVIPRPSSRLKLPRVTLVTKSIPLTLVSLALVAGIASSAVAIALPSREESSSSAPYDSPPTRHQTIIPPPHQIYDEAMYSDPELQKLMATHHGLGAPDSRFVRDGGEQRRELQERYGYSFWMDGMWVLDG